MLPPNATASSCAIASPSPVPVSSRSYAGWIVVALVLATVAATAWWYFRAV